MKGLLNFLKFYLATACAIGVLTGGIAFLIYVFKGHDLLTLKEAILFSFITGALNGFILGAVAISFLTLKYYWSHTKTKVKQKKNDR